MARILRRRVVQMPKVASSRRNLASEINQYLQLGLNVGQILEKIIPDDPTMSRSQMRELIKARFAGQDRAPGVGQQFLEQEVLEGTGGIGDAPVAYPRGADFIDEYTAGQQRLESGASPSPTAVVSPDPSQPDDTPPRTPLPSGEEAVKVVAKGLVEAPKAAQTVDEVLAMYDRLVEASGPRGFFESLGFGMADRMNAVNKAFMVNLSKSPLAQKNDGTNLRAAATLLSQKMRNEQANRRANREDRAKAESRRDEAQMLAIESKERREGQTARDNAAMARIIKRGEIQSLYLQAKQAGQKDLANLNQKHRTINLARRKRNQFAIENHRQGHREKTARLKAELRILTRKPEATREEKALTIEAKKEARSLRDLRDAEVKLETLLSMPSVMEAYMVEDDPLSEDHKAIRDEVAGQLAAVRSRRLQHNDVLDRMRLLAGSNNSLLAVIPVPTGGLELPEWLPVDETEEDEYFSGPMDETEEDEYFSGPMEETGGADPAGDTATIIKNFNPE